MRFVRRWSASTAGIELNSPPKHLKVGTGDCSCPLSFGVEPELFTHPLHLGILKLLLGPDLVIDNISCVIAYPGSREQRLHRDHPDLFARAEGDFTGLPTFAITVAVPLIDLTAETGATKVFRESHRAVVDESPAPTTVGEPGTPLIA
jgi:hypothetical protein